MNNRTGEVDMISAADSRGAHLLGWAQKGHCGQMWLVTPSQTLVLRVGMSNYVATFVISASATVAAISESYRQSYHGAAAAVIRFAVDRVLGVSSFHQRSFVILARPQEAHCE